jgi:hypothetical protein
MASQEFTTTNSTSELVDLTAAIKTLSENVVNCIVEIFGVEDFDDFLELASQIKEPQLQFINKPDDIEPFSDPFDNSEFANFVFDLIEIDGTDVSVEEMRMLRSLLLRIATL